ncbi:MAG: GGDEF domain-containing response regulator, partial [Burkholderiales bacterium]
ASGRLPSPSGVALAIMELAQRDATTLPEVARVIQSDPVLLGRLLKLANSPAIGARRPVATAFDAVVLLGISIIRQLALGLSILSNHADGKCERFDYKGFWSRSLATGIALQTLCQHSRVISPEEGFSCGLLCRVGCLSLATVYPKDYATLIGVGADVFGRDLLESERELFATDHNELTFAMLEDWKLPAVIVQAAFNHEQPEAVINNTRVQGLAQLCHLAAYWAVLCTSDQTARVRLYPQFLKFANGLGFDNRKLIALNDAIVKEWQDWGKILDVPTQAVPSLTALDEHSRALQVEQDTSKEGKPTPKSLSILAVDNDKAALQLLNGALSKAGYEVTLAASGKEGLQLALQTDPDIIITDWTLPEMGGAAFLEALRSSKSGMSKYVIVVTGKDDETTLAKVFAAGANDYIAKPPHPVVLSARVQAGARVQQLRHDLANEMEETRRHVAELAVANRRWEEAALTDMLTGLPNRRYAMDRLKQEWAAATRGARPLSCMLVDVDYFKKLNDSYGHD